MPPPAPHRGRIAIGLLIVGAVAGVWPNAPAYAIGADSTGNLASHDPWQDIHRETTEELSPAMSVFALVSCVINQGGPFGVVRASQEQVDPASGRAECRKVLESHRIIDRTRQDSHALNPPWILNEDPGGENEKQFSTVDLSHPRSEVALVGLDGLFQEVSARME